MYRDKNLLIVFGITLMVVLGVSSIMPVLPQIIRELDVTPESIGLIFTVFTLPGVVLAPLAGIAADRWGRKRLVILSLVVFAVFGTACGFVRDFQVLLILRFVQGIGAASIGVLNLTIIGDLFKGIRRTQAMGYNAAVLSVGTAVYPALGGVLGHFGWHYPFFLPVLALPLALIVHLFLNNPEPEEMTNLRSYFANAARQLQNPQVLVLFLITLMTFILLYGPFVTYFPILMDVKHGVSPVVIGLVISTASFLSALSASQLGRLVQRFTERKLIVFSFGLYALCFFLIPHMRNFWMLIIPATLFGLAQGINIPNVVSLISGYASMENRATMMAVNGMLLRLGQTIGPLLMGLVFAGFGLNMVFYFSVIIAFCMFFVAFAVHRGPTTGEE